ncbi:MAG: hypothetical protein JRG86_20875, partial [Deltaproteobacteria bacterium]|nr:hypothetical protein [Deltaproteobacteria bacterium]
MEFETTSAHLRQAALVATRSVQLNYPLAPDDAEWESIRTEHGLKTLTLLPVKPADRSKEAKRDWFREVARRYPPSHNPRFAQMLYRSNLHELTRSRDNEYCYLYPIPSGAGGGMLVPTVEQSQLAFMDDARGTLMYVLIGAIGVVAVIYYGLYRFILRPFRQLVKSAEDAGRPVTITDDDIEAVVQEYESTIRRLKRTEKELLRLNEETKHRADAVELFNQHLMKSSGSGVIS